MSTQYSPKIITDNLQLYLDAANSKSYPGSGSVWSDITSNGYNGTLTNSPGYGTANGGYISVDGTSSYVLIGPVANIGTSNISVTWCIWVYPISSAGNIMSMSSTNPQGAWNMPPIAAYNYQFFGKIWSNSRIYSSAYTTNNWYYLTLVFNYTTSSQLFYVNGILQGTENPISYGSSGASNYLFLGQSNPGADNTGMFNGRYGSFKIYTNKALTASEILQNYNATKGRYGL